VPYVRRPARACVSQMLSEAWYNSASTLCMGARHHNYRVILLRDCTTPPGSGEFADTLDTANPEGGWMRFVFLRQFETNIGYTSTSSEFTRAVDTALET